MTKKVDEISLGNYHKKAVQSKAMAQMSKAFKYPGDHDATIAKREKGLARAKVRGDKNAEKFKAQADADQQARIQADKENLPALIAQYQKLRAQFDPDYEYSDDYSFWSKQKDLRAKLAGLEQQINRAGGSVKEGIDEGFGRNRNYAHGFASPYAPSLGGRRGEIDDEANLMYIYRDGRVRQKMVDNRDERQARAEGFRDSIEKALRVHNIIRSKFDPNKYVQKAGDKWVPVYPFGKPDEVAEDVAMKEWKKDRKAPIKPRNFVAKNATTGGAGVHKDKKKEAKQGKQKHKKKPELAESATYDRRLNVLLEAKVLTEKIRSLRK